MEALKEQAPESDDGGKKAVIESFAFESGQLKKVPAGQDLEEKAQQLGGGKGGLDFRVGFEGVFLDCV